MLAAARKARKEGHKKTPASRGKMSLMSSLFAETMDRIPLQSMGVWGKVNIGAERAVESFRLEGQRCSSARNVGFSQGTEGGVRLRVSWSIAGG